jgi:hypothetical protein
LTVKPARVEVKPHEVQVNGRLMVFWQAANSVPAAMTTAPLFIAEHEHT